MDGSWKYFWIHKVRDMDKNVSRAFRGFLRFLRILKLILKLDERIKYSNIIFNFSFFSFAITININ